MSIHHIKISPINSSFHDLLHHCKLQVHRVSSPHFLPIALLQVSIDDIQEAADRSAMAENHEVTTAPPQPNSDTHLRPQQHTSPSKDGHSAIHSPYVKPSDLLRPRTSSKPSTTSDRPVDRDERLGLKKIRDFLRLRNCYEVLPLSFRLIELDVGLTVRESLNILVSCGEQPFSPFSTILCLQAATDHVPGIVSAPLWDSTTSTYAGLLTVNDYLNVVRYYNLHADKLKDVDKLLLSDLRDVERVLNVKPPETISASPETVLYDALRKQLISRARRIPLVSYDSDTQRTMVTSVITQYRILKFISMNVRDTDMLKKPLSVIKLGTYSEIVRCSMDSTVLDVIDGMVTRNISSVPVVTMEGQHSPLSPYPTTVLTFTLQAAS